MTSSSGNPTEDETCERFVLPALVRAGWNVEVQVKSRYRINRGRIQPTARRHHQQRPLIADYVLEYSDGLPLAVVEAKRSRIDPAEGFEQAKRYAELLDVPFAYSTNGTRTIEVDYRTGLISEISEFPTPEQLWARYRDDRSLADDAHADLASAPFKLTRNWDGTPKDPRYYQRNAINRAVQTIAKGQRRLLLVLATGTGKTLVSAQIVAKLWNANWPKKGRRPRVLYLADRNILIDQPKDDYFTEMFGEAVHRLGQGRVQKSRNIYFALYQSLSQPGGAQDFYTRFDRDFFDLIIVDECHRGSASEGSQWREILEYFEPAVQLGLTATPISRKDVDTYHYFGDAIYEYSLAQGIRDGFLAPYRVRNVRIDIDLYGWRPDAGQLDMYGREIPDELYGPKDFERIVAILDRTDEVARYLTEYLHKTGRMHKTIVFCQTNDHAMRMVEALTRANADLSQRHGHKWVCRITGDDHEAGRERLDEFRDASSEVPVIAVTSRMLSTGVDIPTVRNIVLFRVIRSMPEFKQTIGRGTRLSPETGKFAFDIIDFVDATRLFYDPKFDGPPLRRLRDEADPDGSFITFPEDLDDTEPEPDPDEVAEPEAEYLGAEGGELPRMITDPDEIDDIRAEGRTYYIDDVEVSIVGTAVFVTETDGTGLRLRLVRLEQFIKDRLHELDLSPNQLLAQWAHSRSRAELRKRLESSGISSADLGELTGRPDADAIDLLIYLGWGLPVLSRSERALRFKLQHREFLESFAPEARTILERLLEQYSSHNEKELELDSDSMKTSPYRGFGTVVEIAERFGDRAGAGLRVAVDQLRTRLYEAS
ncbi:EcoAI/FtnUII family type I restriction enzme subunit R [Streptosporangium sp. CA-115845]|uniref:EcoAI/FtnUII family type I restriction enzme subunit R n=1 Tax=Streptosporangium sp. CA-115845 TaxID=3240071 RepID=UPI003D8A4016